MSARTFATWIANGFRWQPADDWQPGDLAECLQCEGWIIVATGEPCEGPHAGQILRVTEVGMDNGIVGLAFEGVEACWAAVRFRKIRPGRIEACKPAFADQMKRLRPKVDA